MEKIIKKRDNIHLKLKKYQHKIHDLEYQLIELERESNEIDQREIIKQMSLNEQQNKIVIAEQDKENLLVLACPGSGKTHTLISRYINLVTNHHSGKNVDPDKILLITFTKKAGQEMENRLKSIIPTKLPHYVGSLHGLGYRILQRFNKVNYTVLDEKDSKILLRDVIDSTLSIDNVEDEDISLIKSKASMIIDQASTSYPVNLTSVVSKLNLDSYLSVFKKILRNYQETKKKQSLVDFNDLMENAKVFFKKNGLLLNWKEFEKLDVAQKINTLGMIAPITNEEKQKLLETISLENKVNVLDSIISFYLYETNFNNQTVQ